jgi:ketosteroid isomerase-like protein
MAGRARGIALLLVVSECEGGAAVMETAERDAIVAAVEARVRSFEAAERARDPERLIAHFASVPEFHFYHDGRRATYPMMTAGVRGALPAVRSLEVTYGDLQVSVLSAEHALVSGTFRREMVIEATGAASQSNGGVSWLWRKMEGQWLIVHGHISHPLEPAK